MLTAVWQGGGEARGHRAAHGSAHSAPAHSEHRQQRGALPSPSPPCRGWADCVHPAVLLWPTLFFWSPSPPPRRLSGCKVRFIGLCENVKIKTSLSGIKYTPEIKFRDLFAQFLVDKLHITPKGKTSLAYCVHKAGFTLAQRSHIRKEVVKSF